MEIPELNFTKLWTNRDDFPTVEVREDVVRSDMQLLFNELRDHLNQKVRPAIQDLVDDTQLMTPDEMQVIWNTN